MSHSILVVEDEKHLAAGLRYNLKAEGYDVETVGTAEEALALLNDGRRGFDILVLDVMLPGMDGFSLASRLRAQGQFVPILMLTARGQAQDVLRGFEAGADDYLPKPFDLAVLLADTLALKEPHRRHRCLVFVDDGLIAARPSLVGEILGYAARHRARMELVAPPVPVPGGEKIKADISSSDQVIVYVGKYEVMVSGADEESISRPDIEPADAEAIGHAYAVLYAIRAQGPPRPSTARRTGPAAPPRAARSPSCSTSGATGWK